MSYELEYNARSVPPADIARSFIPPEPHFGQLMSRNHTLILGPRGSGKTTLLKMLTVRALSNWAHPYAEAYATNIRFNAAFIPADIAWGKQIDSLEEIDFRPLRKEAAFVLHTLRALIYAMRESVELARKPCPAYMRHLAVDMSSDQEEDFVKFVSNSLKVSPAVSSLLGVELALEDRLDEINSGGGDYSFGVDSFKSKLSLIVSAFNGVTGDQDRRWALLFDELEIAPARIKSFLLASIRSIDERIVVKLALAPYMDDISVDFTPTSPHPLHDYSVVHLTYPNKDEAIKFGSELFISTFKRLGVPIDSLQSIFQAPAGETVFGRRSVRNDKLPKEFLSLSEKDESFRRYVNEKGLLSPDYKFTENNTAQDIRKVFPIVIARNFYIRLFEADRVVKDRSRKSHTLYTGMPSIIEITEGNPRAILTLVGPLAQQYRSQMSNTNKIVPIPPTQQSDAIRRVELLLTSLLQVIPLDMGGFDRGKGLLDFVDQIGRSFEGRLLKRPFATDYVGTFLLDDRVSQSVINAVGKALNAGAIIHVPNPDGGPGILLRGLVGQRFRISYALAARYRLLLTLGDPVNLSRLMMEMRGLNLTQPQISLFDDGGVHDHL